jgi:dynein light intermediate chain
MTSVANGAGSANLGTASAAGEEESNLIGTSFSLVRYNNPVLIDKHQDTPTLTPTTSAKKKKEDKDGDGDAASEAESQRSETEEILDSILPPREWEESGQLWRQSVSSTPATRLDVINLQVFKIHKLPKVEQLW